MNGPAGTPPTRRMNDDRYGRTKAQSSTMNRAHRGSGCSFMIAAEDHRGVEREERPGVIGHEQRAAVGGDVANAGGLDPPPDLVEELEQRVDGLGEVLVEAPLVLAVLALEPPADRLERVAAAAREAPRPRPRRRSADPSRPRPPAAGGAGSRRSPPARRRSSTERSRAAPREPVDDRARVQCGPDLAPAHPGGEVADGRRRRRRRTRTRPPRRAGCCRRRGRSAGSERRRPSSRPDAEALAEAGERRLEERVRDRAPSGGVPAAASG